MNQPSDRSDQTWRYLQQLLNHKQRAEHVRRQLPNLQPLQQLALVCDEFVFADLKHLDGQYLFAPVGHHRGIHHHREH